MTSQENTEELNCIDYVEGYLRDMHDISLVENVDNISQVHYMSQVPLLLTMEDEILDKVSGPNLPADISFARQSTFLNFFSTRDGSASPNTATCEARLFTLTSVTPVQELK
jgi:hypothetical protein